MKYNNTISNMYVNEISFFINFQIFCKSAPKRIVGKNLTYTNVTKPFRHKARLSSNKIKTILYLIQNAGKNNIKLEGILEFEVY